MARTHVVISDETLEAIDKVVGKRGRSRFVQEAAAEGLERLALADAIRASAGIARGTEYSHRRDRDAAVAWDRNTRRSESGR